VKKIKGVTQDANKIKANKFKVHLPWSDSHLFSRRKVFLTQFAGIPHLESLGHIAQLCQSRTVRIKRVKHSLVKLDSSHNNKIVKKQQRCVSLWRLT